MGRELRILETYRVEKRMFRFYLVNQQLSVFNFYKQFNKYSKHS